MKTIYFILLIVISAPLFSGNKTFIREYTYSAGEADSKITSRAIALEQVKRILLEFTKQQILSITAGITETKIVEEKWNGETYYIKASISVDPDEVNKNIYRIGADQNKLKELEDVKHKADEAFAELERLRKELVSTKSENERLAKQKEYVTASNTLSATDWFQKGKNANEIKDYVNEILYYKKAIELDPQFSKAYNNLGLAYYNKGNLDKAIQLYEKAIECNPQIAEAYYNMGLVYYNKGNHDRAVQLYEKAIELNPNMSETYISLGHAYYFKDNLDKAIQLWEKAIEQNSQSSAAFYNLGIAYLKKEKYEMSNKMFQRAAQLGDKEAQQYLTKNGLTW